MRAVAPYQKFQGHFPKHVPLFCTLRAAPRYRNMFVMYSSDPLASPRASMTSLFVCYGTGAQNLAFQQSKSISRSFHASAQCRRSIETAASRTVHQSSRSCALDSIIHDRQQWQLSQCTISNYPPTTSRAGTSACCLCEGEA